MEKDTILGPFFEKEAGPAGPEAKAAEIKQAGKAITAAARELNVPRTSDRLQAAFAGCGGVDQRERSQAYSDLLGRRPELGKGRNLTQARFEAVLSKDRRYDALATQVGEVRGAVRAGLAQVESRLTENVGIVVRFANDQLVATADSGLRSAFLPIGTRLDQIDRQQAEKLGRKELLERASRQALKEGEVEKEAASRKNRLKEAARKGAHLKE
jgi:hypothetical protein